MADKNRYPQIPSTVWWGVRAALSKTPNATFDEKFLSVQLGVQPVAARQYVSELTGAGILDEEKKATPLALKWRLDDTYSEAAKELIASLYPEGLRHVAPPEENDRKKAINYFLQEGLGSGAAGNKAATYFLIGSTLPNEAPTRTAPGRGNTKDTATTTSGGSSKPKRQGEPSKEKIGKAAMPSTRNNRDIDTFPLNINVQIHISADAGTEQIESIFSAMRRYLYEQNN